MIDIINKGGGPLKKKGDQSNFGFSGEPQQRGLLDLIPTVKATTPADTTVAENRKIFEGLGLDTVLRPSRKKRRALVGQDKLGA